MMFTQQTEVTIFTIEPTSREGFSCTKESACKPDRRAPSGNKNAETHGYYGQKIKLEAVSFEDLNFSSSGGEQLPKRSNAKVSQSPCTHKMGSSILGVLRRSRCLACCRTSRG